MRNAEEVTLHAKLATGGEVVIEMGTVRNKVSVVVHRLAQEIGREVIKFGSPDIGGWNFVAQDVFQVATGQVVVALVTQVDGDPELIRHKNLRPRTPSRSPRRKSNVDRSRRQVFGARPPLPVSRPGQQRTYYAGGKKQLHSDDDGGHNRLDELTPHVRGGGEVDEKVVTVDVQEVREVTPTLRFRVQESVCALQEEIGDLTFQVPVLRDPGLVDSNAEFLRVAKHTLATINRVFNLHDRVFTFQDGWVAVQYMPFFPPGCAVEQAFPPEFWVPTVCPSLPQELHAFQVQWEKWAFGQVGFDRKTNLVVQLQEITDLGLWKCFLPSGYSCYLLVHKDYEEWGPFVSGDRFVAFQALQIGCFQGCPLIAVPHIGSGSSLVKRWPGQTCGDIASATYELFAGIGGWHAGLRQFGEQVVVAVEIDPTKAQVLACMLGVPCVEFRDVRPFHLGGSIVLVGDVRGPYWFHLTLLLPAKLVLWSAPCITWSQGGRLKGLGDENGLLLLEAMGICGVFDPLASVGENVVGLLDHPDWLLVQLFLHSLLDRTFQVHKVCLNHLVPMTRTRVFLSLGPHVMELPQFKVEIGIQAWMVSYEDQVLYCQLTDEERELLSRRDLLPPSLRVLAPGYLSARQLLQLRVVQGSLIPTLVASYRYQCYLNADHLAARGLFTWLLDSACGPRYMDAFEAAWLMGFSSSLKLPDSSALAMNCIGNCVAPSQALQILHALWPFLCPQSQVPSFEHMVKSMLLGKPPLRSLRRFSCNGIWTLGYHDVDRSLPDPKCLLVVDSVCAPFGLFLGGGVQTGDVLLAANVAPCWSDVERQIFLEEDFVQVMVYLATVQVMLRDCCFRFSPLTTVGELQAFFGKVMSDYQLRTWNPDQKLSLTEATVVKLNLALKRGVSERVFVAVGLDVRCVEFSSGETLSRLIDRVFPFRLGSFIKVIWHCQERATVRVTDEVTRGAIYQVWFRAGQYLVQPFGLLWLDPFMRIKEVQRLCELRFYNGKAAVTIRANNQMLRHDGPVCWANELGVLRVSIFPLKGGFKGTSGESRSVQTSGAERADEDGVPDSTRRDANEIAVVTSKQFQVEPFGFVWFDPAATLAELKQYYSEVFFQGLVDVTLRINNQILCDDTLVGVANRTGVIRGSIYPMKGGVLSNLTPSAAEELLQEQLVGHGASLAHAKSTADLLVQTAGLATIKKVLEHKDVWGQLKSLATKSNIVLIKYLDRPVDPLQARDPWSAYKDQKTRSRGQKASERLAAKEDHVQVAVDFSFFHANGQELAQVSVEQLFQGVSGLATCDFAEGAKYIREVTGRSLSVKASGLLFTGVPPSDFEIAKHGNAAGLVVPVWLNSKPAALQCVLFQTGDVQVSYHLGKTVKSGTTNTSTDCTMMIHVYRDEASEEGWESFESLATFLRGLGFNATAYLRQVWFVAFYERNRRCSKDKAQYLHGFLKVPDNRHLELLRLSGTRGFYASSRSAERSVDQRYKVIWLDGLTLEEARLQLRATVDHAGLVRSKRGFGVRVGAAQYGLIRQKLLPGAPESSGSDEGGDKKFRLLGVPQALDRSGLKKVLQELGWTAKVLRSQGFQCWVVASANNPPNRSFSIDDVQVVITADMQPQHPVVGGDKESRAQAFTLVNPVSSGYSVPAPAANMQTAVDEASQAKFTNLEKRLEAVEENTAKAQEKTDLRLVGVESRVAEVTTAVGSLSQSVGEQLKASLDHFSKTVEGRFRELASNQAESQRKMEQDRVQQFQELQDLLAHKSPKVRAVQPGGVSPVSGHP